MDLILSNCFYPNFVTACSKFKLFLQRFFFYLKWAEGLELFSLYYGNHVFANVDRFGSKKRHIPRFSTSSERWSKVLHQFMARVRSTRAVNLSAKKKRDVGLQCGSRKRG